MRNEIVRELLTEYEQQRAADQREEQRRRLKAYAEIPGLESLCREREGLVFGGMRAILNGTGTAANLPERMATLNGQIAERLEKAGYPKDWLEPVYRCPTCRDTGYVGEPVREMCGCMRTEYYRRLFDSVGLKEAETQSFESYREELLEDALIPGMNISQRRLMNGIRGMCETYADNYPDCPRRTVLMMGNSGLGKTFMMHAMARRLLERGKSALLLSGYRFLELARKAYFSGTGGDMDTLMDADVLFLDDLGSEPLMDNVTVVQLFNLINERQNAGTGLVISTNLTEDDLKKRYTERVTSRLFDGRRGMVLQFAGPDLRRRR